MFFFEKSHKTLRFPHKWPKYNIQYNIISSQILVYRNLEVKVQRVRGLHIYKYNDWNVCWASFASNWIIWNWAYAFQRPSLKSALRPPPSAWAESANFRPFYVKRADFSPPPPATKKRRKLVKIRPRCLHLATKKRRKVVKIRLCGGWWVGGWPPPLFFFNLITVNWSWYKIGDVIDVIEVLIWLTWWMWLINVNKRIRTLNVSRGRQKTTRQRRLDRDV